MEFMASIYEKTNNGAFFRGHKIIEAENIEDAMKKAELPVDLREIATVEVSPVSRGADECY